MPVSVTTMLPNENLPRSMLARTAKRVLRGEMQEDATITVVITDDSYIRPLNHQYRGYDRATDVLSFALHEGVAPTPTVVGDVYISLDRAREQAIRYRVSLEDELKRLVVHGCLHLLGYDHHRVTERRIMREKETFYLSRRRTPVLTNAHKEPHRRGR